MARENPHMTTLCTQRQAAFCRSIRESAESQDLELAHELYPHAATWATEAASLVREVLVARAFSFRGITFRFIPNTQKVNPY